jgi:hypothetical protein
MPFCHFLIQFVFFFFLFFSFYSFFFFFLFFSFYSFFFFFLFSWYKEIFRFGGGALLWSQYHISIICLGLVIFTVFLVLKPTILSILCPLSIFLFLFGSWAVISTRKRIAVQEALSSEHFHEENIAF